MLKIVFALPSGEMSRTKVDIHIEVIVSPLIPNMSVHSFVCFVQFNIYFITEEFYYKNRRDTKKLYKVMIWL